MRKLAVALALLLAACAEPISPLAGIDLPPASMPDEIEPSAWSISFSHEFGELFWIEGEHAYQLSLDCPQIMDEALNTPPILFNVVRLALPSEHVYLRLGGLSETRIGPINVGAFAPVQPTSAIVSIIGIPEDDLAMAFDSCAGEVTWDLEGSAPLLPGEPFKP